jgi:hypothetical protein
MAARQHARQKGWSTFDLSLVMVSAIVGFFVVAALAQVPAIVDLLAARPSIDLTGGTSINAGAPAPAGGLLTRPDVVETLDIHDGTPRLFANGSELVVSDQLRARVVVSGSDVGRYRRDLDVFVYQNDEVTPATDLDVQAYVRMPGMTGGGVIQPATPSGDGHYLLPLQFSMAGTWLVDVQVAASGQTTDPIRLRFQIWH